ncbi:calcium-binding protein [Rhizobium alvei]|uniref:Uncharacterized protein n=1 Tax=Rhizobium alvei TaxID=1132659 RepID=A0ABT8YH04_9HYPH|nr:hypothetical protein [Rhizobium alvei]MDO6962856.1 hypothetical protein [Rhizobium alvei]
MALYVGNETQDNTVSTFTNFTPLVVGLKGGGFALTWNVNDSTIYTRTFAADGTANSTDETIVVTNGGNYYEMLSGVTALSNGGYQLAWTSLGGDGQYYGVRQQSLTDEGDLSGSLSVVNSYAPGGQTDADLAGFSGGGWIAAYTCWGYGANGSYAITWRAFDADGNARTLNGSSEDTPVNQTGLGGESDAHIAVLESGGWVVTWTTAAVYNDQRPGELNAVCQRVYNDDGTPLTDELRVNVTTENRQAGSDVAALSGGGYVVTWQSEGGQDGSGAGVYQQIYNAAGTALFDHDLLVNSTVTGEQWEASVAALNDGGWVVVWKSNHNGTYDIFQKVFAADGTVLEDEMLVSSTTGTQREAAVAALEDGGWVVTWRGEGQVEGETNSIFHRQYGFTYEAPSGFDKTLKIKEDVTQTLSANYFGFSDDDGNAMKGVIISSLPTKGVLKLNGVAVTTDQMIDAADLGNLTYTPPANAFGTGLAKIGFKVVDDGGTAYDSVDTDASENFVTFNITDVVDVFNGTNGNNTLTGTQGADRFLGMGGNDTLKGLGGIDTFTFRTGDDKDRIIGFDAVGSDHDIINLAGLNSVTSWNDLKNNHMTRSGADVVINGLNGDTITLSGVKLTDLDKGDFVL